MTMAKKRVAKRKRRSINVEDIKRFKLISDPQISPAGDQVVFVVKQVGEKNEYLTQLWLVDTGGEKARQFTSGKKDRSPRWSSDGQQIAFVSEREDKNPQVHLIGIDGGEATALTRFPGETSPGSMGSFHRFHRASACHRPLLQTYRPSVRWPR